MNYVYVIIEEDLIMGGYRIIGFVETEEEAFNIVEDFRKDKKYMSSYSERHYRKVKRY